jgi:hypothetical protein
LSVKLLEKGFLRIFGEFIINISGKVFVIINNQHHVAFKFLNSLNNADEVVQVLVFVICHFQAAETVNEHPTRKH